MKAKSTENLFKKTVADFLNLTDMLRGKPLHIMSQLKLPKVHYKGRIGKVTKEKCCYL